MTKIFLWVFLEAEEPCCVWAQGAQQALGVQFALEALASSRLDTAFCSSALGAPLLTLVAASSPYQVSPKTTGTSAEMIRFRFGI